MQFIILSCFRSNNLCLNVNNISIYSLLFAFFASISWLMPYHYYPWISMHSDAWMAACFCISSFYFLIVSYSTCSWRLIHVLILFAVAIVWFQYYFGIILHLGNAAIISSYLLAFLLCLLISEKQQQSDKSIDFINSLFLAIGFASIVSVGLQVNQWLLPDDALFWNMGSPPTRPHANLAQPNQLATLLFWGILVIVWAWQKRVLSGLTACFTVYYLTFGLALTGSRTTWLGIALIFIAIWYWKKLFISNKIFIHAFFVILFYIFLLFLISYITPFIHFDSNSQRNFITTSSINARFVAWRMFFDAIIDRPWLGYGWNQTALAHTLFSLHQPNLEGVFTFAHNLFFDLLLWSGIPLGLIFISFIIYWFLNTLKSVNNAENAILIMLIIVIGNHAMFEMPLYYAYFLLPTGIIIGKLNLVNTSRTYFFTTKISFFCIWLLCTFFLIVFVKDYLEIEENHMYLRYEQLRIKVKKLGPPDVTILSQWHDIIKISRLEPHNKMSAQEIEHIGKVVSVYPSPLLSHKLATTFALNNRPADASLWLKRLCKMSPEEQCKTAKQIWAKQSTQHPEIAAVPWPSM